MRPDSPAHLWDAREAATQISIFIQGKTLDDYRQDALLRSAVERQFITVGEALNRLERADPEVAARVPDLRQIVGFRNILVHGYAEVQNHRVWNTATTRPEGLIETLDRLLASAAYPQGAEE
ncbi:HepT-like ribonuclease domain-containing protein [Nakamurella aerolata]|uniref:DUF86 domain-containing protein n=1 Tax=Nakamurella aerolata TaxID=1656892 RepID=A0A849AFM3_9ACTN|nr:DUF86 domain-containing protein [Nakamurella aerolata]NNG37270.1 DUF86 domain-containing protein [Nakamurella aerolata]